jgi:hypothetical protein
MKKNGGRKSRETVSLIWNPVLRTRIDFVAGGAELFFLSGAREAQT